MATIDHLRPAPHRLLPTVMLAVAVLLAVAGPAVASTRTEEQQGAALAADVQSGAKKCADLSNTDFERIGEHVMRQMLGSAEAHDAMNRQMTSMMGTAGEERAHIFLGRRFSGCAAGAAPAGFEVMMGMMGSYGGAMGAAGGRYGAGMPGRPGGGDNGWMMRGQGQYGTGNVSSTRGNDDWSTAETVMTAFMAALLLATLVALALWRPWRRPPGESALDVLRRRYAAGDIDTDEFERRRDALGGTA